MPKISNGCKITKNTRTNMKLRQIVHFNGTKLQKNFWSRVMIDDVTMNWSVFYKCVIYRPDCKM